MRGSWDVFAGPARPTAVLSREPVIVLSLYFWRRSAQRGVSGLIAAGAAQALRGRWDEPGSGPGRETDQLGAEEAG